MGRVICLFVLLVSLAGCAGPPVVKFTTVDKPVYHSCPGKPFSLAKLPLQALPPHPTRQEVLQAVRASLILLNGEVGALEKLYGACIK